MCYRFSVNKDVCNICRHARSQDFAAVGVEEVGARALISVVSFSGMGCQRGRARRGKINKMGRRFLSFFVWKLHILVHF